MPSNTNLAYIAGLFDGEGCVSYKQYDRKRPHNKRAYPTWSIRLEISMTDQSVLKWIHEILKVGTVNPKRYKTKYTLGWKKQWRWRCQHREAYYVARLLWPYAHVKLDKIQKIIDHYSSKLEIMNDKVVSLEEYKQAMSLE
tara:strand:- start:201 stop:623 length:423 start_codon:yes stop_codon:yes gene_type:complete